MTKEEKGINKNDLIKLLAEKQGVTLKEAADQLVAVVDLLTEVLSRKENISIFGFGVFSVVERKARMGKNPGTGEDIEIPAKNAITFKPAKALKEIVNVKSSKKTSKKKSKKEGV